MPGLYRINASGWYTHWSPKPAVTKCLDETGDEAATIPAWCNRGRNYNTPDMGMHVRYGSNDSPVRSLRVSPGILEFIHQGGPIGIWDKDDYYGDNSADARYVLEYADTDGDGLPDFTEVEGFRDGIGNWYFTDPNNPDTDGDGLSDGFEAGKLIEVDGKRYFNIISNPMLVDSDDDWLWDNEEIEFGTNPLDSDTDKDTIQDAIDLNPLVYDVPEPEPTVMETVRDITIGAVFGETGVDGGVFNWLVGNEIASSPFYLIGWIVGGLVPVSDVRDALQSLTNLDLLGTALSALGIIPLIGDGSKATGIVGKFIAKYGSDAKKLAKIMKYLSKYLLQYAPDFVSLKVLDSIYDGVATMLKRGDTTIKDILYVVETERNIGKVLNIVKDSSGKVRWLEEGASTWGWTHIKRPERWNQIISKFGPKTDAEVQEMIYDTIKNGKITEYTPRERYTYTKQFIGRDGEMHDFSVGVSDREVGIGKGNIATAHPGT